MILLLVLGIVIVVVGILRSVQQHTVRWMPLISGTVLAIAMAVGLYTAHHSNFLLTKMPLDKTQKIKPAATLLDFKFITTEKGRNGENRYTYKVGNKSYQTLPQNAETTVKTGETAQLETIVTTYQAKSLFSRFMLFGETKLKTGKTQYVLTVPKDWDVLTSAQVKELQKMVKDSNNSITDEVAIQVKKQFADRAKDDENFMKDKDAQQKLQSDIVNKVTADRQANLEKALNEKIQSWQ